MIERNALPILLTIAECFDAADETTLFEERLVHGAVHGWMEGHLSSPGHRLDPANVGAMPYAPFPDLHDPQLGDIIQETLTRFREGEEPAMVAYAVSLGWQVGRATAAECPGCAVAGHDDPLALALRSGRGKFRFHEEGA